MAELLRAIPVLTAVNVPADIAFWVNALGFRLLFSVDGFAGVARDGIRLYIAAVDHQSIPDNTQAWVTVSDVDALRAGWSAAVPRQFDDPSGPAMTEVAERPWGREFAVRDHAGNCVHFVDATDE